MDIKQLAENYQPNQDVIETVKQSRIVLLAGIMAAGKDTIIERLLDGQDYHRIVSHTTRPPRTNNGLAEQNDIDYHFVSIDGMAQLLADNKMIEVNKFGSNYYGTSVAEIAEANRGHKIAITDIDVHGVDSFYKIAPSSITAIFIIPPSYKIWLDRLGKRYQSKESELASVWQERRQVAIDELEYVLQNPNYYFVVNDDLDEAVVQVDKIAHGYSDGNYEIAYTIAKQLINTIKQEV